MDEQVQNENLDSTNETEDTDLSNEESVADTPTEDEVAKLKELNRKLFVRAKTAEGFVLKDGHWVKKTQPVAQPKEIVKEVQPSQNFITKDDYEEGILRTSKGYTDEDVDVLKTVSKGKGISLFQAEQDPMFKLHLSNKAEEEKKSKAQLGTSKGSSSHGVVKESMTREEHMEMFKEKLGR